MKPELTGEEKRIVDVQIGVAMNTEMNVDDLVQYLNKMAKIKHEVTRDVVIKRAKRIHIKLGGYIMAIRPNYHKDERLKQLQREGVI